MSLEDETAFSTASLSRSMVCRWSGLAEDACP